MFLQDMSEHTYHYIYSGLEDKDLFELHTRFQRDMFQRYNFHMYWGLNNSNNLLGKLHRLDYCDLHRNLDHIERHRINLGGKRGQNIQHYWSILYRISFAHFLHILQDTSYNNKQNLSSNYPKGKLVYIAQTQKDTLQMHIYFFQHIFFQLGHRYIHQYKCHIYLLSC